MYKHIVFDVDGTLINTQNAIINALKDTLKILTNKTYETSELLFVLGITGLAALEKLKIENPNVALKLWEEKMDEYKNSICIFDGIEDLLENLKEKYTLGIVTSKTKDEFKKDFSYFNLDKYFKIIICADDTTHHKPNPEPLIKYMESANQKNILYIGDSVYDKMCADGANVDFAFAKWGNENENLKGKYCLNHPLELIKFLEK